MAPRTSTAERYIIEEPASPEETQRLFGMSDRRAATLAKWAAEALDDVEKRKAASKTAAKRSSKRSAKKSAKR